MKLKFYHRFTMVFTTILMFTFIASSQTTITVQINAGIDDAEEITLTDGEHTPGYVDNFSSDLELCTETEGAPQWVGMIFRNVEIPMGETVTEAFIQFTVNDDNDEEIELTIYGAKEATIAPEGFTDADFNVTSHPLTDATVLWNPVPWLIVGEADTNQRTPDISSIINEIIAVDGWAPGNALMILIHDTSTVKAHRQAESYDGNAELAPVLHVTFGGTSGVNPVRDELFSLIYPNPTEGTLKIDNSSADTFSYQIFAISGQLVAASNDIAGSTIEVDLSNFAKGVYFIDVRTAKRTETHKLILK